ncbi:RNA polymerase subunit sigma-24 [Williamsia sp. Leaf354]|uniref:RNA polymerase sigma-70 factor n=1 Tax=Williamsia sp. Leaf354 TaxID=1736349 RepID=UPI00070027B1|nr:RNA polymerase sigma-70 factor [Williamsia sp. Leaf354]KQR97336.1 RNA polymerase subunit sigma-24 [Williamsia sp. Leaf354]
MTGPVRDHAQVFTTLRPLLFTIAYEITGSTTDADDVLQESYLRWADVDLDTVDADRSYLASIVTRQSLNALRSASRRREDYVGPWLPEPLRLDDSDPEADVVLSESVSMAMMVVLETLGPDERAVFVLREVFGFSHAEIAAAVGRSVAAVRQMSHRARSHVQSRRRRFDADGDVTEVTTAFLTAAMTGDVQGLMDMLAPDAVLISDGGGKVNAARRPIHGADAVSRFLVGIARRGIPDPGFEPARYNGSPAVIITSAGDVDSVFVLESRGTTISGVYVVRNPDKLAEVTASHVIAR